MEDWIWAVASALERGFVLTLDYGYPASEYYSPERHRGTLACFRRHLPAGDPYAHIGRQDITAHVEFTSLARAGEEAGLRTCGIPTQGEFLSNLGVDSHIRRLRDLGLTHREVMANRAGMLDLVRPEGMGRFNVLVQGKGVPAASLWGLEGGMPSVELPAPLLETTHVPLFDGRYPHQAADWERLWPRAEDTG
jgi:SAM-dependent MidA family methyltransferase